MPNQVLYGFETLRDQFNQRVSQVGVTVVATAIGQSVDEHNRQMAALMGLFVRSTSEFKIRYKSPIAARLQPMDELGRARAIRGGSTYDIAFPIQKAGAALGATYEQMIKMTVEEANEKTLALVNADLRWMRDHLLAAFFVNSPWTFVDEEYGDLNVYGLANGDGVRYLVQNGADQGMSDNHYLAQAGAIADLANPFPIIHRDLVEHPENGGAVVALIPSNLKDATEGLADFKPVHDTNVSVAANESILTASAPAAAPGELLGYVGKTFVYEWKSLPDNYILATTTEGDRPMAMREHAEAELQGFKQEGERNDHPYFEKQWARRAGFGAYNRINGVVYRIGNAAYAVPSGYDSPMP